MKTKQQNLLHATDLHLTCTFLVQVVSYEIFGTRYK